MLLRVSVGCVSAFLVSQAFASQRLLQTFLVAKDLLHTACLSEISVGDGDIFCISDSFEKEAQSHIVSSTQRLVYIEAENMPVGIEVLISKNNKHVAKISEKQMATLLSDKDIFVMEITFDNTLNPQQENLQIRTPAILKSEETETISIDPNQLRQNLEILVGLRSYNTGTAELKISDRNSKSGKETTRAVLVDFFNKINMNVRTQCYNENSRNPGCNIEATLQGEEADGPIVVGAHYDSVTTGAADDNGSGTATVMEIARQLAGRKLKKSVRFVAFDQEELGLYGSAAYVKDVTSSPSTTPSAAFTMDMIGYDSNNDGALHVIDCGRSESTFLSAVFFQQVARLGTQLSNSSTCTNRTDHSSFWKMKIPAIAVSENFFGGDGNKCYHKACDKIENMNFDYFSRIAQTSANTVFALAQAK